MVQHQAPASLFLRLSSSIAGPARDSTSLQQPLRLGNLLPHQVLQRTPRKAKTGMLGPKLMLSSRNLQVATRPERAAGSPQPAQPFLSLWLLISR